MHSTDKIRRLYPNMTEKVLAGLYGLNESEITDADYAKIDKINIHKFYRETTAHLIPGSWQLMVNYALITILWNHSNLQFQQTGLLAFSSEQFAVFWIMSGTDFCDISFARTHKLSLKIFNKQIFTCFFMKSEICRRKTDF